MNRVLAALLLSICSTSGATLLARSSVPFVNVIAHGDSITDGALATTNYCRFLYLALSQIAPPGTIANVQNRGISGQDFNYIYTASAPTLIVDATNSVDMARINGVPNKEIIFAGTNGLVLQGNSAATEYSYFTNYFQGRLNAGWSASDIIVCTMLPRQSFSETIRSNYNAALVSGAVGLGYKVVRLDLNSDIGVAGAQNNATYFYDTIHPTAAGQYIIYSLIYPQLFP